MAIKAISKGYVVKHDDERHVQNERLILGQLRHPFVVGLFGTLQDKQKIYFVLEYVAGGELFSKLRGNRCLSAAVAKFYLVEILAALAHVHAGGFVYRDLKPENVLLDTEGHCRLVDFGFACAPPDGPEGRCEQTAGHLHIYHRSNYREKRRAVTHALSTGGRLAALRTSSCRGIRLFVLATVWIIYYLY